MGACPGNGCATKKHAQCSRPPSPPLRAVAVPPEALQRVAALSGVGADAEVSDVEDHLDDMTRDFLNAELLAVR